MNWPNVLTVVRIVLTFVFIYLISFDSYQTIILAAAVFLCASLTDFADGYLARKYRIETDFGKIMDPIADKFLVLTVFVAFMEMGLIFNWMVFLIVFREVLVTISRLVAMRRGQVLAAEKAGKVKTVLQISVIAVIFIYLILERSSFAMPWFYRVEGPGLFLIQILMLMAVVVTVTSGISFFINKNKAGLA